jgi:hypothetical protein
VIRAIGREFSGSDEWTPVAGWVFCDKMPTPRKKKPPAPPVRGGGSGGGPGPFRTSGKKRKANHPVGEGRVGRARAADPTRPHDPDTEQIQQLRRIPEVRDRYEVIGVIGSGTFSTVFKVRRNPRDEQPPSGGSSGGAAAVTGQQAAGPSGKSGDCKLARGKKKARERVHFRAMKRIVYGCHPQRIEREIECLKRLEGKHNVVAVSSVVRTTSDRFSSTSVSPSSSWLRKCTNP